MHCCSRTVQTGRRNNSLYQVPQILYILDGRSMQLYLVQRQEILSKRISIWLIQRREKVPFFISGSIDFIYPKQKLSSICYKYERISVIVVSLFAPPLNLLEGPRIMINQLHPLALFWSINIQSISNNKLMQDTAYTLFSLNILVHPVYMRKYCRNTIQAQINTIYIYNRYIECYSVHIGCWQLVHPVYMRMYGDHIGCYKLQLFGYPISPLIINNS